MPVGRSTARGPLPLWPWWLASVPVGRRTAAHCGVTQLPRPQQETFARVSTMSVPYELGVAAQHHGRVQHATWQYRPLGFHKKVDTQMSALELENTCVVLVVRMIHDKASLSWRVRTMQLLGWQNTWEQAPGVPATLSPRQRRTLRHRGLKKLALTSMRTECEKCRKMLQKTIPDVIRAAC